MRDNLLFRTLDSKKRFVIAEIGSNHNGNLESAKKLILESKLAGADAVKLQFFKAEDLVPKVHTEYLNIRNLETPLSWFDELKDYSDEIGLGLFASAFNTEYIRYLVDRKVFAIKIASSEIANLKLMTFYSKLEIPLIVSFGMSEWYEVEIAMSLLTKFGKRDIIPLHCVSNYPLEIDDVNLEIIGSLKSRFGDPIGFSDHSMSTDVGAWAYAFGARVFEKHITLDRGQQGPDHHYALEPSEFKIYVTNIVNLQKASGSARKTYSASEIGGRGRFGCYAIMDLKPGDTLNLESIELKGPRLGIPSNLIHNFLGSRVKNYITKGQYIAFSDLES
jgi:N,N'-diacetyllegionaminate synthase